ncbi:nitrogenase component 1 [Faecalicatena contorta]|uniref:FeMo cofactor biosynthesis protein NifB n=1 Tax=Faecalicatena contorta TaxID=39482 RepID=A0A316ACN3_9FIRM|nr:nitrogenase component 1 [Faecalicatena contorta]PWJ47537.1 nitrogenase cofactor biosynthesis protein NifB [Faecalicatena contorta]SUQ15926.1 nitrogenase cofactor biosynthesis protein NifB [Faecalicatena contorta]
MKTKITSLVNLNTNPCKMCMPMGAATALYGIRDCITILHGSQGCATYIRRHMATHYNEPVDIASSSLTEQGTVYGGEKNLKQGLKNLITLYHPKVIGIMTTCLAETIGEDVEGIKESFYEENPQYRDITILPVSSPGYGGTQYEGYMAVLNAVAGKLEMDTEKNEKVNVILPPSSPADIRYLKSIFRMFEIDAIFFPDISDNLDGGHGEEYSRLPKGGTDITELRKMAGARFTIELSDKDSGVSPARILFEKYQVPYKKILSPVGLKATDDFYELLCELSGKKMPEEIKTARSRYLDGMIDSHKYNSAGRAVIYGEPEFIIAAVRFCAENGIMPVVVSTGSVCPNLKQYVEAEIADMGKRYFVDEYVISDDTDFKEIEEYAVRYKANIMIGNSDGRRIEEQLHIPLVRRAFPVHDRIGGQRLRMLGYEGSLSFLDDITNALLSATETSFRETLYNTYYKGTSIDSGETKQADMMKKTMEHPCYNCAGHKFARIHLPVAPACNVQCNYCVRKFDCPNESRPGVTSTILTPAEALERYKAVKAKMPNLTVAGIAGPGDSLAGNYPEVKKTLELIREYDPDVTFCLSTNGLMLPLYAEELVKLGVSHVTVTMSAVDPSISAEIYKYIDYLGKRYEGEAAGAIMVSNQLSGLRILLAHGIICKVNIVTLKGINEGHIPQVVQTCKDIGCYITNIMQLIPVEGSVFENLPMVSNKEIQNLRNNCNGIMRQMFHCKQCRADAVGTLDNDLSVDLEKLSKKGSTEEEKKEQDKTLKFAIASKSGVYVDMHFGHVEKFYIYQYENGDLRFIENRNVEKYCTGVEECGDTENKITQIISVLHDCDGVIAMRIGEAPKTRLKEKGIQAITAFDKIESAICNAAGEM